MIRIRILMIALLSVATVLNLSACGNQNKVSTATEQDTSNPPLESTVIIDKSRVAENYPADEAFAGGEGTEASPFEIATAGQLALLAKYVNEDVEMENGEKYCKAWYVLTEDIEINDTSHFSEWEHTPPEFSWSAIGDCRDYMCFRGHFDGRDHIISGLYYYGAYAGEGWPEPDHSIGLFGSIYNAVVENVTLDKSYICRLGGMGAGGLMYECAYSTVRNCGSSATVCCEKGYATAGIAAYVTDSQIINCVNSGAVSVESGVSDCGGIIGLGCGISVDGCQNTGRVTAGGGGDVGGIVGSVINSAGDESNMQITNCLNQGEVDGLKCSGSAGGIGGNFDCGKGYLTVSNCRNSGSVTSSGASGGLFGHLCGRVSGISNPEQSRGVVLVENCENSGTVFAKELEKSNVPLIGGLIGSISTADSGEVTISKCSNHADLNADTEQEINVSGVVANCIVNCGGTLRLIECTNTGTLGNGLQTAGILGSITQNSSETAPGVIEIIACENAGDITGNGLTVSGILGWTLLFSGEKDSLTIQNCRNTGALTGYSTMQLGGIGGIAGYLSGEKGKISVIDCDNSAPITLNMGQVDLEQINIPNVSGIVGLVESSAATVEDCSNNGRISVLANGEEVPEYSGVG